MALQFRRIVHVLSLLFVGAFLPILVLTVHATRLLLPEERLALSASGFLVAVILLEIGCLMKVYVTRLDVLSVRRAETSDSPRGGCFALLGYGAVLASAAVSCAAMWFFLQKRTGGGVPAAYNLVVAEVGSPYGVILVGLFLTVAGLLFGIYGLAAGAAAASWRPGSGGGSAGILTTITAAPSAEDLEAYERSRGLR